LLATLGVFAAAVVAILLLIWLFQRKLIYIPMEQRVPPASDVLPTAEEVVFRTDDGLNLHGWFVPAASAPSLATVLVFNGNAGHRAYRAPLAEALAQRGLSVMLFDYRAYGGNPGSQSEQKLIQDGRAARAYLESRSDVNVGSIIFFGESLGAAVALALAVERPPAGVVLRSPFTSLADVGRIHYPFLPVRALLADRYSSIDRIRELRCPLLVFAGEADRIVPAAQSRVLFDTAPGTDKRLVVLPRVGHNDYALLAGAQLIDSIVDLARRALERPEIFGQEVP
jgi:fermentation-respiration switch protein FrsA (DUF1100 family)